ELHGVVDGEGRAHRPTGAVDVQPDVFLRVLAGEEQQLGDHQVGELVVDLPAHEHYAVAKEARIDVVDALAAPGVVDHGRDHHRHFLIAGSRSAASWAPIRSWQEMC